MARSRVLLFLALAGTLVFAPVTVAFADDVPAPAPAQSTAPAPEPPVTPSEQPSTSPTEQPVAPPSDQPVDAPVAPPAPPAKKPLVPSKLPLKYNAYGWRVKEVQQRLQWLGYEISPKDIKWQRMWKSTQSAVKKFQIKQFMKPTGDIGDMTWDKLVKVSGKVGKLPSTCTSQRTLCVDKTQRVLRLVDHGKVQLTLDVRFGMAGTPTREGIFSVHRKSRDHWSTLYHTWMPFAMFFSGGQAVHYSPYFARDGYYGGSHGCIGIRDFKKAAWLYDHIGYGTRVYVYWS